jgi:sarcosine oxidase subunit alpha
VTRLADQRFLLTTTTGGAGAVLDWLEEWLQTEWRDLKVYITSVTEQWSVIALAGPDSRALLQRLAPQATLDNESLPFMSITEGVVAGIAARVLRIGFTGELGYEMHVRSDQASAVWQVVMETGRAFGVTPYGTEAMHVLRAEKGYILIGQETDGTVTPLDLGLERMVSKNKDFIGRRSLSRADTARPDRKQLVGILPEDPGAVPDEGAQLVAGDLPRPRPQRDRPVPMLGHVTSSYWSANLGRSFGLALIRGGRARIGQWAWAPLANKIIRVRIVEPMFWDKDGVRQRA